MEREAAINVAAEWLRSRSHEFGPLRFAGYSWDFRSGCVLWGGHFTRGLIIAPILSPPTDLRLVHGWVVVFNPLDRVPEVAEDCFSVWVPEPDGPVRGRMPQSLDFECTLPLTGSVFSSDES